MEEYRLGIPRGVTVDTSESTYGKFLVTPLESGYGTTLGVSLKRVLLSSLEGAAITHITVNDGLQLYSSVPGVRETVGQIVLQIKQLQVALHGATHAFMTLDVQGTQRVFASDLVYPPEVTLLNSDLYLFTMDDPTAEVSIRFEVRAGEGYVSAEHMEPSTEGSIPIDANFSPVNRVVYDIEPARVRQRTNYDKLVMEIWTNGILTPEESLRRSAKILFRQLSAFNPESDWDIEQSFEQVTNADDELETNPMYDVPIEVLDLSTRVYNSLRRTGITTVGDVLDMLYRGENAMLSIRNFGQTSLEELKQRLTDGGYLQQP